ncbi:VRR-NUC domain-containing protein [Halopseudomonas nanhaiensis]|uniref:VRR-NUC domain-containing protein n=1 Tax=Halopseudomonas nanhaiensis TaxID=2830842 RepID=UPI001CC0014F|nr:VRR-NUC domain-containing protein [Halopseudomonas nanhaiensis]UAW99677.1 VRR-NUC domain-containing protein [Halopseudomonas nanhaiensis]
MQLPDLPADYYLRNFRTAVDWVAVRYADLLAEDEAAFIEAFSGLPPASQALLVRLVMRKGPHFRVSRLSYPEIGDLRAAVKPLLGIGWLDDVHPLSINDICALLRRDELLAHFAEHVPHRGIAKGELVARLQSACLHLQSLSSWCPALDETVLTLTVGDCCDRLRLLFFGNLNQDWSEFVLADLGVFRYEQVPFSTASRGFTCRRDVEDYLHLFRCREAFDNGEDVSAVIGRLGSFTTNNRHLRLRHAKLLLRMGQHLERCGGLEDAIDLYRASSYPGARQRHVRVLEKLQRFDEAWGLVQIALQAPESDTERQLMTRAQARLAGKLGKPRPARSAAAPHGLLELTLPRPDAGSVEYAVREHLLQPDAPVYYVENTLINSLFGLLFWDAIFAPLPGAFFHPFQGAPADLHDSDFRRRRETLLAERFAQLDDGTHAATIRQAYVDKHGLQSPFVFWGALNEDLLELALHCLPAHQLKACFERLLDDIRANRTGMPDLIQFWPAERRFRMIEVKGPGDRLQDNQRRWLAFCALHDIPVDVCHVRWADA